MGNLTEKQLAEMRQMKATGIARHKEQRIRDLTQDLRDGRVPIAVPSVSAALRELASEIKFLLGE